MANFQIFLLESPLVRRRLPREAGLRVRMRRAALPGRPVSVSFAVLLTFCQCSNDRKLIIHSTI